MGFNFGFDFGFNSRRETASVVAPQVTDDPDNGSYDGVTAVTLTVVASGTTPTYQWYTGDSGDTSSPIGGATGASYDASPTAAIQTKYWCRVTNAAGSADSAAATVTYAPTTLPISFKMDFDAEAGVTGTTNISAWANQGSVSFSVQDNGGGHMPTLNADDAHFNGYNSVQYDAGDALYNDGANAPGQVFSTTAKHFLAVMRIVSYGDGVTCVIGDNSHATGKFIVRPNAGADGVRATNDAGATPDDADAGSGVPAAGATVLVEVMHDGTNLKIKVGAGSYVSTASGTTEALGAYFMMGNSSYGGTGAWKATRMLGHNAVLNAAQLVQARAYLSNRYALGLAS